MAKYKRFRYGRLSWLALALSLTVTGMAIYAFTRAAQAPRDGDLIYFAVGIPFVAVLVISPLLAYRDVIVSDEGVGRAFFGFQTRFVHWEKVEAVRCGVVSKGDSSVGSYHLQTRIESPFGGVRITSMIDDVGSLVDAISKEVTRREIPVSAWEVNKLIILDRLPPPKKGPAAWN